MPVRVEDPPMSVTARPEVMVTRRSVPGDADVIRSPLPLALPNDRVVPAEAAS